MPQNESINSTEDYVNYTFHISSKGVGAVAGELVGLSNTVSNLLGDIAFKTSEMLAYTETLAIGTSVAVGAMFTSAVKDAIRFEQQMANVKAIGGESLNTKEIGNAAMEYSNKFGMATASMTEGLEALARAGITTTSVMKSVLEEGVKLSKLEGMDLEDSINDLIATTNLLSPDNVNMNDAQYADMVKQMNQHIVSTSESAPINAQNIIQSLQHVGGYASASGIDQDDLFAVIAQLGSRGTKGEMAGTALRAFVAAGQKDTAQRALARIGLNVSDLWGDNGEVMLSISEMKDVLDDALEARGYSKQEKLEFYSDFAGYKQANQIMKIDTSEVQQYKEQIANAWDLGKKLENILGTVRGNLDRIWQITQNFMTKVGGKILFIANAILTPVRMLLELITKMPFADTAVAAGMIIVGFNGVLKIINNIVPRFSTFFMQLSQSKHDMFNIKQIWKDLPGDIDKAKDVLKAMSDPKEMIRIQQKRQLYSKKEIEVAENKVAKMQFIQANLEDPALLNLTTNERRKYLGATWDKKDEIYKQNFIDTLKIEDPKEYERMMKDYLERVISDSNLSASRASYDMVEIMNNEETALWEINEYVGWIYRSMGGLTVNENGHDNNSLSPSSSNDTESNRQRNARVNERKIAFDNIGNNILSHRSEYGDYSYKVSPNIDMPKFNYNDIEGMRRFEAQVQSEIERKIDMFTNFFEDSSIEEGRKRIKKSLTVAAKTDLGYEFSTGANTSDIKKILETGNIREGSSHILDEQLQTIADILDTNLTGDKHADMLNFSNILNSRDNKDELLASILKKTQEQWNNKYYNNGKVGYFATNALKEASGGVTAQKIIEKVGGGVSSIEEVQERFKNVDLNNPLLNECVDIIYQDKELVEKLVNEEIKYMYENLVRVQNSILRASREGHDDSTFQNMGEEYVTNSQKAIDYVLADFNPNEFERFTSSPNGSIGKFTISQAIDAQNEHLLQDTGYKKNIEGFQEYIYPIGGDVARSQRYGNDNFKIRNIKYVPYNKLLSQNVEEVFLDRHGDIGYYFMEIFEDWVSEIADFDRGYWETTFDADYAADYWISGFEGGQEKFNELKQELEEIYRAYVDLCAWGAQSLIEATTLYGPIVSYRAGRLYTPENSFGAFDTITSTSLHYGVAKKFWDKNQKQRKMLEIFSPEDTHGVLAHTDLLNDGNKYFWTIERELTLGKDQPYLHLPNPEGFEERLLMLTDDQKNAVKEIMGEGFEFQKNVPFNTFLNDGESSSTSNILRNKLSLMLNKDILTADNIGIKLQDLLTNGAIFVDTEYKGGSLGGSNSDDVIDINTGTIKYHADNYNDLYGDYGHALLDTVLHEMTHVLMMHKERQNYQNNNIPSELGIDNFKTSQLIEGYSKNFVAEYEAQYVSSQVLNRLGIEASQKSQQRMVAFKNLIENKGYGDQIQYELLDNLVDEMLSNITVIGDITKELSTQFDMASAGVTSIQVSEDMRPILSKIQAFNKDMIPYQGNNLDSKKDEVAQVLSDMETDMELLWSSGVFDKELIYNMVAQKYAPYIETLDDVNLNQFLEHASPNFKNEGNNGQLTLHDFFGPLTEDNIFSIEESVEEYLKYIKEQKQRITNGIVAASEEQQLIYNALSDFKEKPENSQKTVMPFNDLKKYIINKSDKKTAESAIKWINDNYGPNGKIGKMLGTSKNGVYISRMKEIIEANSDLSKVVSDYVNVAVKTAEGEEKIISLPLHSAEPHYRTNDNGEYILDEKGNKILHQGYMNKFIHRSTKIDMTRKGEKIKVPITHEGITDIIDTDFFKKLPREEQAKVYNTIIKYEEHTIKDVQAPDDKIKKTMKPNRKFGVINTGTTGLSCPSSMSNGTCPFPEHCYARRDMIRLPNVAKNQMQKAAYFTGHNVEELVQGIIKRDLSVVRINQEGDVASIKELEKVIAIANALPEVDFYGYTKNLDVLQYMWNEGLPKNLTMNNSLGTSEKGNYVAASFYELADLIEDGYELCFGACAECAKCTKDFLNKVTLLRDGTISKIFSVEDLHGFKPSEQVQILRTIYDMEAKGHELNRKLIENVINDARITSTTQKNTGFKNKGENNILVNNSRQSTLDEWASMKDNSDIGEAYKAYYIREQEILALKQQILNEEINNQQQGEIYAEEHRKRQKELRELQKEAYQVEKKKLEELENLQENKTQDNQSIWDKIREAIVVGTSHYYYFGGEKKEVQTPWQKKMQNWGLNATNKAQGYVNKGWEKLSNFNDTYYNEEKKENISNKFSAVKTAIINVLEPMKQFNSGLERAAEIFPPLTIATTALNTVIGIGEGIVWGLGVAETFVNGAKTYEALMNTGLFASEQALIISRALETAEIWALDVAIAALEILISGPVLIAIAAVVAAIALVKFWENKHAESLKESQKALEEATAKNNVALSQYKDLKKARENETNAIKKQKIARREAIALYELEAARLKKRKAVQDEAKLRNDAVWGEYGLRASLQKMGLGFIAGGDFQSQYENYDGTTANIRQVKESTLGNLFASSEQRYVASVYDKNSAFLAEVEAYKEPLQALYDKESQLIEQYGSIDLARGTKEFEDAVQEFADATGLNGETAGKMLDWLETENRVNQATQAMKAQVNIITARANAKALSAEVEDTPLLDDNHTLEQAMIMAQAQDIYKEAYDYMWWEKFQADLFGILWTIIDHMAFWDMTDNATKYWKKSEAYEEGMRELTELGVRGVYDIGNEVAENADRRDYGAGPSAYSDSPFGAALESAELMEAEYSQQMALERRYTMDETQKFQKELNEGMIQTGQSGVEGFKTGLDQHSPGAISRSMGDEMIYTQEAIQKNYDMLMLESRQVGEDSVISFKDGLGQDPEGNISKSVNDEMIYTQEALENNREPIKELSYDIGYESGEQYGQGFMDGLKSLYEQISTPEALTQSLEDRILVRQGYGVPEGANPNDPEVQSQQTERRAKTESKLFARSGVGSALISAGKREGKAALRVAAKEGVNWQNASVVGRIVNSAEIMASDGLKAGAKALFAPKKASNIPTGKVAGTVDDTLKGASKYGSKVLEKLGIDTSVDMGGKALGWIARNFGDDAAKGAAKLGGKAVKAIPFLGTAMTAAFSIAEHNPFEKHYNEDGSEKRAFQSTGEVAGSIAGSLAADAIGIFAGPVAGMLAGFVLEPIGEAIGGTIGWLTDEVVNTKFTDAWAGFNDALGGIPNQIVGFIDQSPIGQAGHFVFNQLDNLTGGWLGETWDKVQNSSIMELPGVIGEQLWNGATGLWDSLTGGNNQEQQKLPDIGEKMPNVSQPNTGAQSTIIIKNININTEDDPEKIKSALMNLIIEMQEQVSPRQVSRTVGKPPAQSTSTTQNENNTPEAEGADAQSGAQNGDQNNNPTT